MWLITMVIVSPLTGVDPLPNGRTPWLINRGDPNYLQVLGAHPPSRGRESVYIIKGILATPPKATPPRNKGLIRPY